MDTIATNRLGWMSKAERAQVRAHSGLEWVFHEPRGLRSLRRAVPAAPEEITMIESVYQRAASGAAVSVPRISVSWRSWAAWAAAGVLAILALMLLPRLIDLRPQSAWAMVDGYILEYNLEFEEEYTQSAAAAPEHPLNALIIKVHEWDSQHRRELGGDGSPRTSVDIREVYSAPSPSSAHRASLRILAPGATEELRDDLIATLAAIDGLSEPKVYSQRWYYREKYPELFYEDHRLIINGQAYQFPEDFSSDEIESLMMYVYHSATGGGRLYVAYLEIGKSSRFDLGDVVSIDANGAGDIEISTYAEKLEFAPGEKATASKSWWVLIPPEEKSLDYDPIEMLKRQVSPEWNESLQAKRPTIVAIGRAGTVMVVDLLPARQWLGIPSQQLNRELTSKDKERAATLYAEVQNAVGSWADDLPAAAAADQLEWTVKPMGTDTTPIQAWIEIWTQAGSGYHSYLSDLQQQIAAIPGAALDRFDTSEPLEKLAETATKVYPPRIRDHYTFYYKLLPGGTTDLFEDEIPALWSEEEKQQARDTAARMEAAFNAWIQLHPELQEEREMDPFWQDMLERNSLETNRQYCYIDFYEHAGVLRSVSVVLYRDDPELAAALQAALALPGVPEAKISKPGDPRNPPETQDYFDHRVGYRIEWEMFSDAEIGRCIALGRTPDAFTAEQRENARDVLGRIRDRWREWLADHPAIAGLKYKGRSVHHAQTEHLAGVPIEFWIQLGVEDKDLLADVLAFLDVSGAPEPVVKNIREEREAAKKPAEAKSKSYMHEPPVDGYQLVYYFYPQVETMYMTYEEMLDRYSDDERQNKAELARRLMAVFRSWKSDHSLADDQAQAMVMIIADYSGPYPTDIVDSAFPGILINGIALRLFVDSEELYQSLREALEDFPVEPASTSGKTQLTRIPFEGDSVVVH